MSLLHVTSNLGSAQMLEAALIAGNISKRGCRNKKFGGDGPTSYEHHDSMFFVYVVGARADLFKPIC